VIYVWAPADMDADELDAALEAPWVPIGFTHDQHKAADNAKYCTSGGKQRPTRAMKVYKLVEVMYFNADAKQSG